jgi:hypothetical protein
VAPDIDIWVHKVIASIVRLSLDQVGLRRVILKRIA